jgi:hypothetical protein
VPTHVRVWPASPAGLGVPASQTGPCVERHEPDFGRYMYIYESSSPGRTCQPDWYVYGHLNSCHSV